MSKWRRRTAPLFFAAALTCGGCAVGPDFSPPPVSAPATWSGSRGTDKPISKWWMELKDPELISLIDRAHGSNLDLKQAVARIEQSRAVYDQAFATILPSLSATGDARRSGRGGGGLSVVNGSTVSQTQQGGGVTNVFRAGFDASWEIDLFGGIRRSIEAADASLQQTEQEYRQVLVTLNGDIASRYATIRGTQEQLRVAEENIAIQRATLSIVERRAAVGFASSLDELNARADLASSEGSLPPLQSQIRQDIYAISVLLGQEPLSLEQELTQPTPLPDGPIDTILAYPTTVLRQRPDVRAAEHALHRATAQVGVAIANLLPRVSLSALTNLQGSTLGALDNWGDRLWSLVAAANQPIFAGGRLTAAVREQRAIVEQAALEYQKTVLNALKEVEGALINVTTERIRAESLSKSASERRQALNRARELYASGLVEFLQVLDVQRALFVTENNLAISRRNALVYLVTLYKAVGGGAEQLEGTALGAT